MRPCVFCLIVAFTLAGPGCTSSQTSTAVTAPASVKCQVQVGSAPTSFTADGGSGTLAITTTRDCTWSVATSASWVAIASTAGQGEASVPYTVSSNPVPVPRAAEISVSDATLQVSQAPAPCRFSMSPATGSVGAAGGAFTVQLSTLAGCAWTAMTDASWLTITSGGSGSASGPIVVSAAGNTGAARTARLIAAEATFTMTQSAVSGPAPAPTPPPSPSPAPARVSGKLSAFSGQCPSVSFTVGTTQVLATASTVYSDGNCKDLRNGRNVTVTGVVQTDGRLLATIIDVN
jgi:Domain of unknown function (DUF5666)/Putative binding domain, N-terminal/Viral BACON domain